MIDIIKKGEREERRRERGEWNTVCEDLSPSNSHTV